MGRTIENRLPAPGLAVHFHSSAVLPGNLLDQAQSEPASANLSLARPAASIERFEQMRNLRGRNPRAAIRHRNRNLSGEPLDRDLHRVVLASVLDRIRDEIGDSPAEGVLVAEHEEILGGKGGLHLDLALAGVGRAVGYRGARDSVVETLSLGECRRLRLHARELEHFLDQVLEAAALRLDETAVASYLRSAGYRTVREVLGRGTDDRERGAELVGDAGDELHLALAELRRPPRGDGQKNDARRQKEEDPGAEREVPGPRPSHDRVERALAMTDENRPRTLVVKEIRRRRRRPAAADRDRARGPGRGRGRPTADLNERRLAEASGDRMTSGALSREEKMTRLASSTTTMSKSRDSSWPNTRAAISGRRLSAITSFLRTTIDAAGPRAPGSQRPGTTIESGSLETRASGGPGSRGRLRCGFRSASARSESRSSPGGGLVRCEGAVFQQSPELELPVIEAEAIEVGHDIRVVGLVPELGERFRKLGRRTHREGPKDAGELEVQLAAEAGERGAQAGPQPLRLGAAQSSRPAVLEPGENEKKGEKREWQQEAESPSRLHRDHDSFYASRRRERPAVIRLLHPLQKICSVLIPKPAWVRYSRGEGE